MIASEPSTPKCLRLFGAVVLLCGIAQSSSPQQSSGPPTVSSVAGVRIIAIDVRKYPHVTARLDIVDKAGHFALSVLESDVRLRIVGVEKRTEGGPAFKLNSYSTQGRSLATMLLVDQSGSMKLTIPECRQAASAYNSMLSANDVVGLATFGTSTQVLQAPTHDRAAFQDAVAAIAPTTQDTSIVDGVWTCLGALLQAPGDKRALVILSDGKDNSSRHSADELITAARSQSILLCCVALGPNVDTALLRRLADGSGGIYRRVQLPGELGAVYREMAISLHNEYLLEADLNAVSEPCKWYDFRVAVSLGGASVEATRRFLTDSAPPTWPASFSARGRRSEVIAVSSGAVLAVLVICLGIVARRRRQAA